MHSREVKGCKTSLAGHTSRGTFSQTTCNEGTACAAAGHQSLLEVAAAAAAVVLANRAWPSGSWACCCGWGLLFEQLQVWAETFKRLTHVYALLVPCMAVQAQGCCR